MLLPNSVNIDYNPTNVETFPTRTYKLDTRSGRIAGFVDGQDAMLQAAEKIFRTERFAYVIYSALYGIELEPLIGAPIDFVQAVLPDRVEEAVLIDDRFTSAETLQITQVAKDSVFARVRLTSIFGDIANQVEVTI